MKLILIVVLWLITKEVTPNYFKPLNLANSLNGIN